MEGFGKGRPVMRIAYLEEFLELGRRLSFSEAARELHISQSALSKHLQALEEDLGTRLVDRGKHHVMLTPQGELFMSKAASIANIYREAQQTFIADARNEHRLVIGGLVDSPMCYSWLSRACAKVAAAVPDFSAHFVPVSSVAPMTQLVEGNIDCAIISYQASDYPQSMQRQVQAVQVAMNQLFAVVSADNPLAQGERIASVQLQGKRFIRMVSPRTASGWNSMQRWLGRNGIAFTTRDVQVFSTLDITQLNLGDDILLMPEHDIHFDLIAATGKRVVPIEAEFPAAPLDLVFRADEDKPIMRTFIESLKATRQDGPAVHPHGPARVYQAQV